MPEALFDVINAGDSGGNRFIKAWKRGVQFEDAAVEQLKNMARLPFVRPYVAAMPDCHWGMGSTVGSVIPTVGAICPAAVGVDIGCGMLASRLNIKRESLPADLAELRAEIEKAIPMGRTDNGGDGDRGSWGVAPPEIKALWDSTFLAEYEKLCTQFTGMRSKKTQQHLGTLGTGNHFIELAVAEDHQVWTILHSGSRGMGNRIGTSFTQLAKKLCDKWFVQLPDPDLAYLPVGTPEFEGYNRALHLAQKFAWENRILMQAQVMRTVRKYAPQVQEEQTVHCHHNYMAWESHGGKNIMITRKGAVRARLGDLGVIPGSMGACSYIVRGLGSDDSFHSCSHGAGRSMSRNQAKKKFTLEDHARATAGVECEKGSGVLDETPEAYKPIDAVMAAQTDLVEPLHKLKQFLCCKGLGE